MKVNFDRKITTWNCPGAENGSRQQHAVTRWLLTISISPLAHHVSFTRTRTADSFSEQIEGKSNESCEQ